MLFALNGAGYGSAGRRRDLFCGEDCEGEGPEAVVVGAFGVAEADLAGFSELVFLDVEFLK